MFPKVLDHEEILGASDAALKFFHFFTLNLIFLILAANIVNLTFIGSR